MMVSSFLDYGATGSFKITHLGLGPTEIRLAFIGLNTALIVFGTRFLQVALLRRLRDQNRQPPICSMTPS